MARCRVLSRSDSISDLPSGPASRCLAETDPLGGFLFARLQLNERVMTLAGHKNEKAFIIMLEVSYAYRNE